MSFVDLGMALESSPSDLPEYSTDKRLEQPHAKEDQNQSQKGKERIESENLAANQENNGQDIIKDTPQIMAIKDQQQSSPFGSWMVVKKNARRGKQLNQEPKKEGYATNQSSRFNILSDLKEENSNQVNQSRINSNPSMKGKEISKNQWQKSGTNQNRSSNVQKLKNQ
ncbi:hypothetical protein HN51_057594 [Arachis hypogaea]